MTHVRPSAALLLSLFAVLLCACVPGARGGGGPAPEALTASLRADTALAVDSAAGRIARGCPGAGEAKRVCVEQALAAVLAGAGVAKAMAVLDYLVEHDGQVLRAAHPLAHGLGIAAYRSPGTVAQTFASCPVTQISGCHHGVIQGYFLDLGRRGGEVSTEALDALCEPHRAVGPLFFQCAHGMGHGLMALLANHVPAALEHCDRATDPFVRDSCYGGVFMENIVAVTHPEHTAHGHAELTGAGAGDGASNGHEGHAEGGHEGHGASGHDGHAADGHGGHARAASRPAWKPLDRDDPLYPCTAVAEKYHHQCYLIQTAAILPATGGDVAETARICARAPGRMVQVCYASLGRDLTSYAARDPRGTAALCAKAGAAAEPGCVRGAAVSLVDVSANPADGLAFCRVVSGAALKTTCYQGVGASIMAFIPEPARREALCAGAEAEFVAACRAGAGLPAAAAAAPSR